eukprot:TCONS_00055202-protein
MKNHHILFSTLATLLLIVHFVKLEETEIAEEGHCDGDEPCFFDDIDDEEDASVPVTLRKDGDEKQNGEYPVFDHLSRLDGVKVGDVLKKVVNGKTYELHTRSLKPLLFEIPNAITEDEILHIRERAKFFTDGLIQSEARGGLTPMDNFKPSKKKGKGLGPAADFVNWDLDENKIIDLNEVQLFCRNYNFLYFDEKEIIEMFKRVEITEFDDGKITPEEFETLNTLGIEDYLNIVMREHPKHRQRTSDQVWLPMSEEYDVVLSNLRNRFGEIFKIPQRVLLGSEHMQIVRYKPGGHYHAHHDTETHKATNKPCCHHTSTATIKQHGRCRLCRILFGFAWNSFAEVVDLEIYFRNMGCVVIRSHSYCSHYAIS